MLRYRTAIYIVRRHVRRHDIRAHLTSITKACGGGTVSEVQGTWVGGDGNLIEESVLRYEWWHNTSMQVQEVAVLALNLRGLGEASVMVERYCPQHGWRAQFYGEQP